MGSLKAAFGMDDYFQHFKSSSRNWLLVGRDMLSKDTVAMGQHNTEDWLEERWDLFLAACAKVASFVTYMGRQAAQGPSPCWDPQGWGGMPVIKVTALMAVGADRLTYRFSDQWNQSLDVFESSLVKDENYWLNPERWGLSFRHQGTETGDQKCFSVSLLQLTMVNRPNFFSSLFSICRISHLSKEHESLMPCSQMNSTALQHASNQLCMP